MLKKAYKLSKFEINNLKKEKYTNIKSVFFNINTYKINNLIKFCVIISKKNIKKSHDRNALKRKIYFIYNTFMNKNTDKDINKNSINILYINKNTKQIDLEKLTFSELKNEIENLLNN
jgi:ribonuclease P protein component